MLATGLAGAASADVASDIDAITSSLMRPIQLAGEEPERFELAQRMADHNVPGVSIAYFDRGEIIWARTWGVKDAGTRELLTTDTMFQAASISKPVAAIGLLTMVEDGLVDLDTDVNRYLTSWSLPENEYTAERAVTLRMITSHTAGLTVHGFLGYEVGHPVPSTIEVLDGTSPANSKPVRVDLVPWSEVRYSGGGYVLMQLLMTDVDGTPFPELMRNRVLDPLQMAHSTFEQPPPARQRREVATAHDGNGTPIDGRFHVYPELAAAGLWTTPTDLARLAISVQRAHAGATDGVLSPATTREMLTAQWGRRGIGFALREGADGSVTAFVHGGSNEGFRARFFSHVDGDGIVIMTNGDNGGALLAEILMAADSVYEWEEYDLTIKQVFDLPAEQLQRYVGRYQITDPVSAVVIVKPKPRGVSIEAVGFGSAEDYYPESETDFFDRTGARARFELGDDGTATAVLFGRIRADRVGP